MNKIVIKYFISGFTVATHCSCLLTANDETFYCLFVSLTNVVVFCGLILVFLWLMRR